MRMISRDAMRIADFLRRKHIDPKDAGAVLDDIVTENGLLREQAQDIYGFLHLTLQEYFSSQLLSERHKLSELLTRLGDPWWEETLLLYAGHTYDASPLIAHLLQQVGQDGIAPEDIFASKLILAGRCLAMHPMLDDTSLHGEVCQRLFDILLTTTYTTLLNKVAQVLVEIARAYPDSEIWQRLVSRLSVENNQANRNICDAILDGTRLAGSLGQQKALMPFLFQGQDSVYNKYSIASILGELQDPEIRQELLSKLDDAQYAKSHSAIAYALDKTHIYDQAIIEKLLNLLTDPTADLFTRTSSAEVLMRTEIAHPQPVIHRLLPLLSDYQAPYLLMRCYIDLLRHLKAGEATPILIELLQDPRFDSNLYSAAVTALEYVGNNPALDFLASLLINENCHEVLHACIVFVLMRRRPQHYDIELLRLLKEQNTPLSLRKKIAESFGDYGNSASIPYLRSIFSDSVLPEDLLAYIAYALAANGQREAISVLRSMLAERGLKLDPLADEDPGGIWIPPHIYDKIAKLLAHNADRVTLHNFYSGHKTSPYLRDKIIRAIARAGDSSFVPDFLTTLADRTTNDDVRLAFVEAIELLAYDEATVRELLTLYEQEEEAYVKDAIYTALYKIARRANLTIIPSGVEERVLRIARR